MGKIKKFTAFLLAVVMLAAVMPVSAAKSAFFAAQTETQLAELMDFSGRVQKMREQYGVLPTRDGLDDPFCLARIIVKSSGDIDFSGSAAHVSRSNGIHVLQYQTSEEAERAVKYYSGLPCVEYAVPDLVINTAATPGSDEFKSWGYNSENVDAYNFNQWLYLNSGSSIASLPEIVVAVLDTGVDPNHPFLSGRLVSGYDFGDGDDNPSSTDKHGTHVTGTVADGTFSNVKVMPIKIFGDSGFSDTLTICSGIEYAYLNGCRVANLSLSGPCYHDEEHDYMEEVIDAAFENGMAVCVAAGNAASDAGEYCPANIERALTVGNITSDHFLSSTSNFGECVDVVAPGDHIYSCVPNNRYETMSGTSMACPHASAAAAMILSFDPDFGADAVVNLIKSAARYIGIDYAGTGMVNVTDLFKYDAYLNAEGQSSHFTSSCSYPWTVEGSLGAASGNAGVNNSVSTIGSVQKMGSGQSVTFECRVSSQEGHDHLRFKANGQTLWEQSGEHGWQTISVDIPVSGAVTLEWEYSKDASGSTGSDRAWVRNVTVIKTLSSAANADGMAFVFASGGQYPWTPGENAAVSGNAFADGSTSEMTLTEFFQRGQTLSFSYKVSSDSGDCFSFILDGETVFTSGNTGGFVKYEFAVETSGTHTLKFRYTKDASGSSGNDAAYIKDFKAVHSFQSAATACDLPDLVNNSTYPWKVEGNHITTTNKGKKNTECTVALTLAMEAGQTLSFRYAVSCENNYDYLRFTANGTEYLKKSGVVGWTEYVFTAGTTGSYTFKWTYKKDYIGDANEDCAYLDDISWSGADIPEPIPEPVWGDIDGNGVSDTFDALFVLRHTLGLIELTPVQLAAADVNADGTVDTFDALMILRRNLGLL